MWMNVLDSVGRLLQYYASDAAVNAIKRLPSQRQIFALVDAHHLRRRPFRARHSSA